MLQLEKFFTNVFDKGTITSARLVNFGHHTLNRLMDTNVDNNNTPLIGILTPALDKLKAQLGSTDTAFGSQKGKTLTVDQFIDEFKESISRCEGVLLFVFGGNHTPGYKEFFPNGLREYSVASKIRIPVLLNRLREVSAKYASKLEPTMLQQLKEFENTWQTIRNEQVKQKAAVTSNRSNRDEARKEVELALLYIIHVLANRYPANIEECMSYFDVSLLYGQSRKQKKVEEAA